MTYDVMQEVGAIDFAPSSRTAEILQNARTVLTTLKKSVPMDRDFGISGELVDLPIPAAQARYTSMIVAAVHCYEPRAQVVSVNYRGDGKEGVLTPIVKVRLRDESA